MHRLPLYEGYGPTKSFAQTTAPIDRDIFPPKGPRGRACDRCKLSEKTKARNPCLPAIGDPGGLLVIGEQPGTQEDNLGAPFAGTGGRMTKDLIAKHWNGPVAFDSAVRCLPYKGEIKPKYIEECRGFLTSTLREVAPTRIVCLGPHAAYSLLGRTSGGPLSTRGAYAWIPGTDAPIPVFFVMPPSWAQRNEFLKAWFVQDMKRALTRPDPPHGPWQSEALMVRTAKDAVDACRELATHRWVAFDVETTGTMWEDEFRVVALSICGDGDEEPYTWDVDALANKDVYQPMLDLLSSKKIPKVGQNVKFDQLAMRSAYGITVRPVVGDTRLMRKILEPEASGALGDMAELIGMGGCKQEAEDLQGEIVKKVKRSLKKGINPGDDIVKGLAIPLHVDAALRLAKLDQVDDMVDRYKFGLLPAEVLNRYNARDVVATVRLARWLEDDLPKAESIHNVWSNVVLPASIGLERVEAWGVPVSRGNIDRFDRYLAAEESKHKAILDQYGKDVNWNSRDQVADLLFNKLKLPVVKGTATGKASTDASVLEELKDKHPLCSALLDYRYCNHLRGTYASGMYAHVRSDERIHPNVKLDGARSGRTSCTDPNLQNIPRADDVEGKMARDCFVARDGYDLLELDYSQLELRVACMLSQDPVMLEIFTSGVDYHLRTAQLISNLAWGIDPDKVEKKHRSIAKTVNFGVLYGKTAPSFAEEWGTSKRKAQEIVDAIMGNFKVLQKWCKARQAEAERTGRVWTWWDGKPARFRPLWRIADRNDAAAVTARNGAVNSPIQGTASEFCVASLAECIKWIEDDGVEDVCKLVLPIHDALLFEVKRGYVPYVANQVHEIMAGWNSAGVPLVVDAKVGRSWGSMEDYEIERAAAA